MNQSVRFLIALVVTVILVFLQASAQIRMTAGSLKTVLDSLAVTFATDAKLALVTCSDVDTVGKSSVWRYVYFSFDSSKEYHFLAQNYHAIFDTSRGMRIGIGVLNVPWIDSDSALSVAQRKGGSDIRRRFPTCSITATLVRYISPPFLCYWRIDYICSDSTRTALINAASGDLVTSMNRTNNSALPIRPWLHQNYPNPFNPSTTIRYELPKAANVTIKIFNTLGQEIAVLVNERKDTGSYQVQWNATVPSGIYFYRFQAGEYVETKKMILLR